MKLFCSHCRYRNIIVASLPFFFFFFFFFYAFVGFFLLGFSRNALPLHEYPLIFFGFVLLTKGDKMSTKKILLCGES